MCFHALHSAAMPGQRCTVCAHPDVGTIDEHFRRGASILQLARDTGLTRDALGRHTKRHTPRHVIPVPPPGQGGPPRAARIGSETAKELFLDAYRSSGNISTSAAAAGTTRSVVRGWQEKDEQFVLAFQQAEIEAVEMLEAEARERAVKGSKLVRQVIRNGHLIEEVVEWRPSDAILVKLLQALRPEKYGEKLSVTQTSIVKTVANDVWDAV